MCYSFLLTRDIYLGLCPKPRGLSLWFSKGVTLQSHSYVVLYTLEYYAARRLMASLWIFWIPLRWLQIMTILYFYAFLHKRFMTDYHPEEEQNKLA